MSKPFEHTDETLAFVTAAGPSRPPPEAVPKGVMPRRELLDARDALGWIAWHTVSWQPLETLPQGAERAELERQLDCAHCELVKALASGRLRAWACKPSKYITASSSGFQVRPNGEAELLQASVFFTPGIRISPHGYVTLHYDPGYDTAELPQYLSVRFLASDVRSLWPTPDAPSLRHIAPSDLERAWERLIAECKRTNKRPTNQQQCVAIKEEFPHHTPPTVRTMRDLRRLPVTPKEWSRQGRHPTPKSKRDGE